MALAAKIISQRPHQLMWNHLPLLIKREKEPIAIRDTRNMLDAINAVTEATLE